MNPFDIQKLAVQLAAQLPKSAELPRISDRLLSPAQAAEVLGCHHQTVRKLMRAGKLKSIRVTERRLGIRQSEIERHLKENEAA